METKQILAMIEYKPCVLVPIVEGDDEPPELASQVVKLDRGRLLVKVDSQSELVKGRVEVDLEVPTKKALFRIFASVERTVPTSEGACIAYLVIENIETIQRRKQDRFQVNLPCRFVPLAEGEKLSDVVGREFAFGRVVNISLGGLQFETEFDLPVGLHLYIEMRMPNGHLEFQGKIVTKARQVSDLNFYGMKFTSVDTVTHQRLNRLILRIERQERRAKVEGAPRGGSRREAESRFGRAISDRWESRELRRRRGWR